MLGLSLIYVTFGEIPVIAASALAAIATVSLFRLKLGIVRTLGITALAALIARLTLE